MEGSEMRREDGFQNTSSKGHVTVKGSKVFVMRWKRVRRMMLGRPLILGVWDEGRGRLLPGSCLTVRKRILGPLD